ncbi:MAG: ribulose-phosphate 3-epimerase [Clostridia bacterium]|nr:ribulose-phosphate 3-epimerase [Clostridia bacterium]
MIKISPSLLASDFSKLGEEAAACYEAGAEMIHIDVMDGHFVPNITLGAPVIKSLRKCTPAVSDVHLMISDPYKYITDFHGAGADMITFHLESDSNPSDTVALIKSLGMKAGIALKPATPGEAVFPYLKDLDMVLVMTVEPGFGGQSFMENQLPKIEAVRRECERLGIPMAIQVDGGIAADTAPLVKKAGADVLVAGSFVFKGNKKEAVELLKKPV